MARLTSRRAGAVPWSALLLLLTALASGLAAAVLWRAVHTQAPPALEGADALVAEAERLLASGDAGAAVLRYGEALELEPTRADALVGRARARRLAGADPLLARGDVERALAHDPRSSGALRELAELRLARGDLRGAREALDRALAATDGAPRQVVAEVDALADVRARLEEATRAEQATIERARALLEGLDGGAARSMLAEALAATPESGPLARALADVEADLGLFDDAARHAAEAARLDPSQALDPDDLEHVRVAARASPPGPPPPLEAWCPAWGGAWRLQDGVISGQGNGKGVYDLALLIAAEPAPGTSATLFTELSLGQGAPGPYAGVVVGALGKGDLYLVYVFHDPEHARASIPPPELEEHRRRTGAWPKFVRVARILDGRWEHRSTQRAAFPDSGWVTLAVELDGATLTPVVAGERLEPVRLERPLEGRVGLAKFYDTSARWRGFRVDAR